MNYKQFQFLMLLWKMGVVDTFNVLKICVNCGSQYMGVVVSSAAGNFSDIGPRVLLEPVLGLGTGIKYVAAAATIVEKRQRIATLAAFLSTSVAVLSLSTDPKTNAAVGGVVASKIVYMQSILVRGGSSQIEQYVLILSLKNFRIIADSNQVITAHFYRAQFMAKSTTIIQNMFHEHNLRRFRPFLPGFEETLRFLPTSFFLPKLNQLKVLPLKVGSVVL